VRQVQERRKIILWDSKGKMESILSTVEDTLLGSLSYKIDPKSGSSYVTEKKSVTFFASGSNIYDPLRGTKVLRFNLASDQFIDLSSLVVSVMCNVGVTGIATPLSTAGHILFNRLRFIVSGTVVEDIENFAVASQLFHRCLSHEKKVNTSQCGFGPDPLPANGMRNVLMFPKISGLCNQPLWLPGFALGAAGCVMELHLADGDEVFQSGEGQNTTYALSDCRVLADVYTLSNELHDTFSKHILSGRSLVFPIKTVVSTQFQLQALTPSFTLSIQRAYSRLNSVFVTMHATPTTLLRDTNNFILSGHPELVSARLTCGSKQYPDGHPITGLSQFFLRLLQTLGIVHSGSHTVDMTREHFQTTHFVTAFDLERVASSTGSGLNASRGEAITLEFKGLGNTHQRAHVFCHADLIMELGDQGCTVMQ
jgi:hypothetical protein